MQKAVSWLIVAVLLANVAFAYMNIEHANLYYQDGLLESRITVDRDNEEDVKITVVIPELGIRMREGPLDDQDNPLQETLYSDVDADGYYWARITVSSDGERRVIYRPVWIG